MRNGQPRNRNAAAKGDGTAKPVEAYFAGLSEPARSMLNDVRTTIRSVVPPETTETISYGMPTFKYKGALVSIGAFSQHCSFFPLSARIIVAFENELKGFKTSKGTIQFTQDHPLSATLIKKLVKARIAENETKHKG